MFPLSRAIIGIAVSARVLVGTCSWTDPTLIDSGAFYPREVTSPAERLRFYAQNFPIVEVDSTYYGLPSERNAGLWVERTPADFTFDLKAYALFTHHPTQVRSLPKDVREALDAKACPERRRRAREKANVYYRDLPSELRDEMWQRFASALLPLDSVGKLGVVLFQFPPWFMPGRESTDYILEVQEERLPQYTIAVEFRNNRWLSETNRQRTLRFLSDHRIPFVCVDEPQGFRSSVPPLAEATASDALVRFHGRNREMWERKGITASERFRYLYTEDELKEWVPPIQRLAEQAERVHVLMNNCYQDFAVRNARQMAKLLGAEGDRSPSAPQPRLPLG
ncbi:MAG: DUF72 domain-containing protein [Dehalococcoidia bacterium]